MCTRIHWAGSSPGIRRRTQCSVPPGGGGSPASAATRSLASSGPSAIQSEVEAGGVADDLGDLRQDGGHGRPGRERPADEEQLASLSLPVLRGPRPRPLERRELPDDDARR